MNIPDFIDFPNTETVSALSSATKTTFLDKEVRATTFEEGLPYGPLYHVDGDKFEPRPDDSPKWARYCGKIKPRNRKHAIELYRPNKKNPCTHLWTFYILIPVGTLKRPIIFEGLEDKTGKTWQGYLNNAAVKYIVKKTCEKLN